MNERSQSELGSALGLAWHGIAGWEGKRGRTTNEAGIKTTADGRQRANEAIFLLRILFWAALELTRVGMAAGGRRRNREEDEEEGRS